MKRLRECLYEVVYGLAIVLPFTLLAYILLLIVIGLVYRE